MTARERFIKIAKFERKNDPSFFGIFAWNDAYRRWKKEGMPVSNFVNMKDINMHFLGYQDQVFETISPNAAVGGMGALMNPPWVPALDPLFEPEVLKDEGDTIVQVDYDGAIVKRKKDYLVFFSMAVIFSYRLYTFFINSYFQLL